MVGDATQTTPPHSSPAFAILKDHDFIDCILGPLNWDTHSFSLCFWWCKTKQCTCWLAVYHYQICSIIRWYDWLLVSQPGRMLSVCSCKCETIRLSHKQFPSWHWWSVCCCYILLLFYQPSLLEIIKPWDYLLDIKLNNRLDFLSLKYCSRPLHNVFNSICFLWHKILPVLSH